MSDEEFERLATRWFEGQNFDAADDLVVECRRARESEASLGQECGVVAIHRDIALGLVTKHEAEIAALKRELDESQEAYVREVRCGQEMVAEIAALEVHLDDTAAFLEGAHAEIKALRERTERAEQKQFAADAIGEDAVRRQLAAEANRDRLAEIIRDAPHGTPCRATDDRRKADDRRCTCWKAAAMGRET